MSTSDDKPLPAVGVFWIEEADYPAALKMFEDGATLPPTWKDWLKMAEEMKKGLEAYGHPVMKVRQPKAYLERFFRVASGDLTNPFFSHLPRWALTTKLKACFSDDVRASIESYSAIDELEGELPTGYSSWTPFNKSEYLEAALLLPGYILSSQGDRMAMANSVEARYPFLDHRVVEFAAKLPVDLKMKVLDEKHLLKRAARGLIPERIRRRRKQPYRAPNGKSLLGHGFAEELLSAERVRRDGVFDTNAVAALIRKFRSGQPVSARDDMALVGILSTQLLLESFIHGRGGSLRARLWRG